MANYCLQIFGDSLVNKSLDDYPVREINGTKYSRVDEVKFFKGCLPQILLGPFLNTLSHLNLLEII